MTISALSLLALLLTTAHRGDLAPVPHPPLDDLDDSVRTQIEEHQNRVDSLIAPAMSDGEEASDEALAAAFGNLGRVYLAYSRREPALISFANASLLAPDDFRWHYLAALTAVEAGETQAAETSFLRALELRPRGLPIHLRFGDLLLATGRYEAAESRYLAALELDPESAAARYGLGRCAAVRGDGDRAIELFLQVLKRQPDADVVHYQLALVYRDQGKKDLARQELAKRGDALPVFPDPVFEAARSLAVGPAADLLRAKRALRHGDLETARELYGGIARSDPENVAAHQGLAATLKRGGDLPGAVAEYRAIVELGEASPSVLLNLGTLLASLDAHEQAIEAFRQALERAPDFRDGHFNLALELARRGDIAAAERHFQEVLRLDPQDPQALVELARLSAASGHVQEAVEALGALHIHGSSDAPTCILLGTLLGRLGRFPEAAEHFAHATELLPESGEAWTGRVMALLLGEGCGSTLPVLEEALEQASLFPLKHLLARLLATCPSARHRDGERALRLAMEVADRQETPSHLETLAMAQAELGRFDEAMASQRRALETARRWGEPDPAMQKRLSLYSRGQPCREPWKR